MDNEGITVLSLFDGMSCGQIALERAGIKVKQYLASEIDKYAIQITQKNYPNTLQIGDVNYVSYKNGVLYYKGGDAEVNIDLVIGGSPCQGFSLAGKGLNFDDPRSKLFFEYHRILEEINPKHFLLENVVMKQEWQDIISKYLGTIPVEINSELVSAQNRKRLYWTNIHNINKPENKCITLKDIFDYHDCSTWEQKFNFSKIHTNIHEYLKIDRKGNIKKNQEKASCLTGGHRGDGNHSDMDLIIHKDNTVRRYSPLECERLQTVPDGYTEGVSNTQRYKMLSNGWTVDVITYIFENLKSELNN